MNIFFGIMMIIFGLMTIYPAIIILTDFYDSRFEAIVCKVCGIFLVIMVIFCFVVSGLWICGVGI